MNCFSEEELTIAEIMSKKAPLFYREEAYNTVLMGIWQAKLSWDPSKADYYPHIVAKAKYALIDELRSFFGKEGSSKNLTKRAQVPLIETIHDNPCDDSVEETVLMTLGVPVFQESFDLLDPKERHIIGCLYLSMKKQDIASTMGVSAGRISQMLIKIREKVYSSLKNEYGLAF